MFAPSQQYYPDTPLIIFPDFKVPIPTFPRNSSGMYWNCFAPQSESLPKLVLMSLCNYRSAFLLVGKKLNKTSSLSIGRAECPIQSTPGIV
jgi:hypothetical protein